MTRPYMEEIVWERFQQKLLASHQWPCVYSFKFIVPVESFKQVLEIFGDEPVSTKYSSNQKYVSVSAEFRIENCRDVVEIYRAASKIKGVIAL